MHPAPARARLTTSIYNELRRLAGYYMRGERPGHTLQPTAIVNEAYLRMNGAEAGLVKNRSEFLGIAAHLMREVLVDHARRKRAAKRGGGGVPVPLEDSMALDAGRIDEILPVHEALEELAKAYPREAQVVELRFFGGLSVKETADCLGRSETGIKDDWSFARAWLNKRLRS